MRREIKLEQHEGEKEIKDVDHEKIERYMNYMVGQYEAKNLESKQYVSLLIKFLDKILFTETRLSGIFYGSQMRGQSDMVDLGVNVSDTKQNLSEVEIISLIYQYLKENDTRLYEQFGLVIHTTNSMQELSLEPINDQK